MDSLDLVARRRVGGVVPYYTLGLRTIATPFRREATCIEAVRIGGPFRVGPSVHTRGRMSVCRPGGACRSLVPPRPKFMEASEPSWGWDRPTPYRALSFECGIACRAAARELCYPGSLSQGTAAPRHRWRRQVPDRVLRPALDGSTARSPTPGRSRKNWAGWSGRFDGDRERRRKSAALFKTVPTAPGAELPKLQIIGDPPFASGVVRYYTHTRREPVYFSRSRSVMRRGVVRYYTMPHHCASSAQQ